MDDVTRYLEKARNALIGACDIEEFDRIFDCLIYERELEMEGNGWREPLSHQVGGSHYKNMAIQPFDYIHKNGIPFAEGSVIKYVSRWRSKGGVDDLKKAKHFIEMLIAVEETAARRLAAIEKLTAVKEYIPND